TFSAVAGAGTGLGVFTSISCVRIEGVFWHIAYRRDSMIARWLRYTSIPNTSDGVRRPARRRMPRNIEIKARIKSVDELMPKVRSIATQGPWELRQDDTFFACPGGRLKLRVGSEGAGELIYYRRDNQAGPKESFYQRF